MIRRQLFSVGRCRKPMIFLKSSMNASLQDFPYPESIKRLKIYQSQNENITLLGAAALVNLNCSISGQVFIRNFFPGSFFLFP